MESPVVSCPLVERKDADVVEQIVAAKWILYSHEECSNAEVAWPKRLSTHPVIQKELNRLVQHGFSIRVLGEAESI